VSIHSSILSVPHISEWRVASGKWERVLCFSILLLLSILFNYTATRAVANGWWQVDWSLYPANAFLLRQTIPSVQASSGKISCGIYKYHGLISRGDVRVCHSLYYCTNDTWEIPGGSAACIHRGKSWPECLLLQYSHTHHRPV